MMTHEQDFLINAVWRVVKKREYDRKRYEANHELYRKNARLWAKANPERKRENARRWYGENAERYREKARRRYEANPKRCREKVQLWKKVNSERYREKARRRYEANPERQHESSRRWAKTHPDKVKAIKHRRRARKQQTMGDFTAEQWKALCKHFKNHCLKCGRPRRLTPDHVIPISWADRPEYAGVALADVDNLQPLCRPCNSSKNATHVDYRTNPHRNCINPPMVEDYLI